MIFGSYRLGHTWHGRPARVPHGQDARATQGNKAVSGFTVLELMVVIGVLSVLLAIVIPTIKTARSAALRNRARVEANVLAQAAIHYKNVYGFWPGQLQAKNDETVELRPKFQGVNYIPVIISRPGNTTFKVTTSGGADPIYLDENEVYQAFRQIGSKEGSLYKPNPLNPKGINFIDLENETDRLQANLLDPWDRGYILFMGLNPKSTFTHTVTFPNGTTQVVPVKNTIAFAFSFGPDGAKSTNYIYSAGVKP